MSLVRKRIMSFERRGEDAERKKTPMKQQTGRQTAWKMTLRKTIGRKKTEEGSSTMTPLSSAEKRMKKERIQKMGNGMLDD